MVQERELGKWGKRGQMLSMLFVFGAVIYAMTLYSFGGERDQNLAYTAMYLDDLAVDLYRVNASYDAILYASGTAVRFCDLYMLEIRTLEGKRYAPLCEAIGDRAFLLTACGDGSEMCDDFLIDNLEAELDEAEPLAKELKENPPYYGYILSYEPMVQYRDQAGDPVTILPG